jgi:hypothetical protein
MPSHLTTQPTTSGRSLWQIFRSERPNFKLSSAVLIVKLLQWAKAFQDFVMVEVVPKLAGWLHEIDTKLWAWAEAARDAIYKKVIEIGTYIVNGIKDGITKEWNKLVDHLKAWRSATRPRQ